MIEIVRVGGATIAVRDELADSVIAVCLRCRGFGVLWKMDCTPSYWTRPPRATRQRGRQSDDK